MSEHDATPPARREEILARVYRRGGTLRARRRAAYGGAVTAVIAMLAAPPVWLGSRTSRSDQSLTSSQSPSPSGPVVVESASPTPAPTRSPAPSPSPVGSPAASSPLPRPSATRAATDCQAADMVASVASRKASYAWGSGDPGQPEPEHVHLDIRVTNGGGDCVWFGAVGYQFENVEPEPGNYDPGRYDQCVWFLGEERTVFRAGETRRWTQEWDQRCGAPRARYRTGTAPGTFQFTLRVCVCPPPRCEVVGAECGSIDWDHPVASTRFELQNRSVSDSRSPSPGGTILPSPG